MLAEMTDTRPTIVGEEWRPVVGWEGYYEVSSQGRVRNVWNARGPNFLTLQCDKHGRLFYLMRHTSQVSYQRVPLAAVTGAGVTEFGLKLRRRHYDRNKPKQEFPSLLGEEWRSVPGFARHEVSSAGRVRCRAKSGMRPPRLLDGTLQAGYRYVRLDDGRWRGVHQLVALVFHGPQPEGLVVRHLDGDKTNNSMGNLAWGTHSQNMLDVKWHGGGGGHKLTIDNIKAIRRGIRLGMGLGWLARHFHVHHSTIRKIKKGELHWDID